MLADRELAVAATNRVLANLEQELRRLERELAELTEQRHDLRRDHREGAA